MTIITNPVPKSILSPEITIRNAWARTLSLSSNSAIQTSNEANNAKNQMKTILDNAQSYEETRYVNEVYSAIESTFRSLVSARNHFSLNLEELKERRQKSIEALDSTTTVSLDFQSLISRISAITFGGTGGLTAWGFLTNFIKGLLPNLPNVETVLLPLFLVTGAAIGYVLNNLWFIPRKAEKIQQQLIKTDYDKIIYYTFYLKRVRSALENLYDTTNTLYKDIFNSGDYPNLKTAKESVDNVLKSMDMNDFVCEHLKDHIADEIDADTWVICETGINKVKCDRYK